MNDHSDSERESLEEKIGQIFTYFGVDHQKLKAIEEMSELTQVLSRSARGVDNRDEIREEIADCFVVLTQLQYHYGYFEILNRMNFKVNRTLKFIHAESDRKINDNHSQTS